MEACQIRSGKGPGTSSSDDHPNLSPREKDVLELVAQGFSAKEVAQKLGITYRTVDRHSGNIRRKLRARNRAHLVAKAIGFSELSEERDEGEEADK